MYFNYICTYTVGDLDINIKEVFNHIFTNYCKQLTAYNIETKYK